MGSSFTIFLALIAISISLLEPQFATSEPDLLSPLLSPIIGDICNRVGCGKGKCKMSRKSDFEYECECDPGWKQTLFTNSSSSSSSAEFKFLPCVIPNCTLNSSCSEAAPSPQPQETLSNTSLFEPCRWANCGGGMCNKISGLTYACHCKEGYNNLFNNTGFPCFKECSIGGDCPNLGLPMSNRSTASPPSSLNDRGSNHGCSLKHKVLSHWTILLATSIVAAAAL